VQEEENKMCERENKNVSGHERKGRRDGGQRAAHQSSPPTGGGDGDEPTSLSNAHSQQPAMHETHFHKEIHTIKRKASVEQRIDARKAK
jgi:hypothetical protein